MDILFLAFCSVLTESLLAGRATARLISITHVIVTHGLALETPLTTAPAKVHHHVRKHLRTESLGLVLAEPVVVGVTLSNHLLLKAAGL